MRPRLRSAAVCMVLIIVGYGEIAPAHEDGHVTIEKEEAVQKGMEIVQLLVSRGKLEASWADAVLDEAELKVVDLEQWRVVFRNEQASDPDKEKLFIFLTADGQLLGANFTGDVR